MAADEMIRYELELPAKPAAVAAARHAVERFSAYHGADSDRVGIAVTEAVANAVAHAYPDSSRGPVQITGWADEETVQIAVRDLGWGLHPNPDGAGGRGLAVIRSVADRVFIASTEFGVEVVMAFGRLTGPDSRSSAN